MELSEVSPRAKGVSQYVQEAELQGSIASGSFRSGRPL